jgi:hypothetical protein
VAEQGKADRRRITLDLSDARVRYLDSLKREWGLRNRGDVLERLLDTLFPAAEEEDEPLDSGSALEDSAAADAPDLDEQGALVLVSRGGLEPIGASFEPAEGSSRGPGGRSGGRGGGRGGGGIDLPGFVRKRSGELRRSLNSTPADPAAASPLPRLADDSARLALETVRNHWIGLYGSEANEAVLEAAMTWLAMDIWLQAEPVEGRPFTWSAACALMQELVEGWSSDPPDFARVIVTAGVVEDPFSAGTLVLRIPTLIHRFVQRLRRRPKGTSFQTLEHTMTLQGALKLLEIPADLGRRVTLAQIREAYRERALQHHPDAGGSVEAMRRLNEAYQLLKELYRQPVAAGAGQGPKLN